MSSVCHGPEIRRPLPAPRQVWVCQRAGQLGRHRKAPVKHSLETCSTDKKLMQEIHAGLPAAEPEVTSAPDCWLVFAEPQDVQTGFRIHELQMETDASACSVLLDQMCGFCKLGPFLLRVVRGLLGTLALETCMKGCIRYSELRKVSILARLAQAALCFSSRAKESLGM